MGANVLSSRKPLFGVRDDLHQLNPEKPIRARPFPSATGKPLPALEERTMSTYSFTLHVAGVDTEKDNFEDAFYGVDCDDALISAANGVVFLDFDREETSYGRAVESAIRDVERAGGKVFKVDQIFA
jgi:hypothetical protein